MFQSNNKKQIVFFSTLFAKSKKRFVIFINDDDDDENNEIRTFIKIFKFVIKQKIENFLIESQSFIIKNSIKFQKFSFKRSFFDNSIFILIRVIKQVFTSTFFTLKLRNYLQSIILNQKN